MPTEYYKEKDELEKEMKLQDDNIIIPRTHMDDEYALSIYRDPQIVITTSRSPSSKIITFMKVLNTIYLTKQLKELGLIFPNSTRVNRGALVVGEIVKNSIQKNFSDLIIVHEHRGEPDGIVICHLPLGPTLYLGVANPVTRHDLKQRPAPMSEAYPHLIFEGFTTPLGERITQIIKHLYPVPRPDSRRVITFSNQNDVISFRHHNYSKQGPEVQLEEVGPRFELKPYQITLGTLGQQEAQKEWVYRPFQNTAQTKTYL